MGRWCVFLTLGAVLLLDLVDAQDDAQGCPLDGGEEHPWLIRISMLQGNPMETKTSDGTMIKFFDDNDKIQFAAGAKENPYYRYKRDDTPIPEKAAPSGTPPAGKLRVAPSAEPSGEPAADPGQTPAAPERPDEPYQLPEPRGEDSQPQAGASTMHGALIAPGRVLSTPYNQYELMFKMPMADGTMSLIGYNTKKNCMQQKWGVDIKYHPRASEHSLNVGEFAIILVKGVFVVAGEPFLFGPSGLPPVLDIINAYNDLVEKGDDAMVTMYLFKDNKELKDGSTYNESVTTFKFIPWRLCQEMSNLMLAGARGMSPEANAGTFFCSMGIPGIMNVSLTRETSSYGSDWYQGAPVIYTTDDGDNIPMGHYVYRVGISGDPRIYATYTTVLSGWLQSPAVEDKDQTLPDQNTPDEPTGVQTTQPTGVPRSPVTPAVQGSHVTVAQVYVVITCAFASASAIHFA